MSGMLFRTQYIESPPPREVSLGRQFTGKNSFRPGGRGWIFTAKLSTGKDFSGGRFYNGAPAARMRHYRSSFHHSAASSSTSSSSITRLFVFLSARTSSGLVELLSMQVSRILPRRRRPFLCWIISFAFFCSVRLFPWYSASPVRQMQLLSSGQHAITCIQRTVRRTGRRRTSN